MEVGKDVFRSLVCAVTPVASAGVPLGASTRGVTDGKTLGVTFLGAAFSLRSGRPFGVLAGSVVVDATNGAVIVDVTNGAVVVDVPNGAVIVDVTNGAASDVLTSAVPVDADATTGDLPTCFWTGLRTTVASCGSLAAAWSCDTTGWVEVDFFLSKRAFFQAGMGTGAFVLISSALRCCALEGCVVAAGGGATDGGISRLFLLEETRDDASSWSYSRGASFVACSSAAGVEFCGRGGSACGWSRRASVMDSCSVGCCALSCGTLFSVTGGGALEDDTASPAFEGTAGWGCFAVSFGTSGAGVGVVCSLVSEAVFVTFPGGSVRGAVVAEGGF